MSWIVQLIVLQIQNADSADSIFSFASTFTHLKNTWRFENDIGLFMKSSSKVLQISKMGSLYGTRYKASFWGYWKKLFFLECISLHCLLECLRLVPCGDRTGLMLGGESNDRVVYHPPFYLTCGAVYSIAMGTIGSQRVLWSDRAKKRWIFFLLRPRG